MAHKIPSNEDLLVLAIPNCHSPPEILMGFLRVHQQNGKKPPNLKMNKQEPQNPTQKKYTSIDPKQLRQYQ